MIDVDIKALVRRLNPFCSRALEGAAGLCVSRGHYEVTVEHLLTRLVEEPSGDVPQVLHHFRVNSSQLLALLTRALDAQRGGNQGRPVFSPLLLSWFQDAWLLASLEYGEPAIRSGVLFAALHAHPDRYVATDLSGVLETIPRDELRKNLPVLCAGSAEQSQAREAASAAVPDGGAAPAADGAIARFCVDFTARARAGEVDPVFGRDREIRQMIDILARRRKNNPIVVGDPGVGKTAVVEGLALRIAEGDVPDVLRNVRLLMLDLGLLQAGAGVRGEFENRLRQVIAEIKGSPIPIVTFIDEAHTLIGAGGPAGGGDAANLLKPALARGELRTIAATTWSEYKKYFEKDAALERRFQIVKLDEPSEEDTIVMLRGLRDRYEAAHGVRILDEALVAAAKLSSRYISGRQLPDKAVDLVDTTAARVKIGHVTRPETLDDLERRIEVLRREKAARTRDAGSDAETLKELTALEEEIERLTSEAHGLSEKWQREKEALTRLLAARKAADGAEAVAELDAALAAYEDVHRECGLLSLDVDPESVARVVSTWTGIPVGKMVRDEAASILTFRERLAQRIRGQEQALAAVDRGIRASRAGLSNPRAPIGVFLFVGPSGVGKTECALGVADLLFGGERFMVTVNMSEFQEKHTVSRLIGSPPGYVGYGEGGLLTEAVRQRPYSVVLLDEVEKADPEVMNLFYQVFDKGMLSDGEGRIIDFKNTVVFMTSNLATDILTGLGSSPVPPDPAEVVSAIRPVLSKHFKPALLARMTIVPFMPIGPEIMREIVDLKVRQVADRLQRSHRMRFEVEPRVLDVIASRCTEVETGARNVDHILQENLLPLLSTSILTRMAEGPLPPSVKLSASDRDEFSLSFDGEGGA